MTLLLATNNLHKKRELEAIHPGLVLLLPADAGFAGWDHDETADTFQGNALGKARSLWELAKGQWAVLADDSGICVDALGGAPGVISARWGSAEAGRALSDAEKNTLLLARMQGVSARNARFVCALALVLSPWLLALVPFPLVVGFFLVCLLPLAICPWQLFEARCPFAVGLFPSHFASCFLVLDSPGLSPLALGSSP